MTSSSTTSTTNASIDIGFIIDATGSMADAIDGVKRHIKKIVRGLEQHVGQVCVRTAIVAYRDYQDDIPDSQTREFEVLDFTTDIERFQKFLAGLAAVGGRDEAEDVHTGLEQAVHLNWASASRLVVFIADAPCHGKAYHGSLRIGDDFPNGDKRGRTSLALLTLLKNSCGVNSFKFIHLAPTTKPMVAKWHDELVTNDTTVGTEDWISEDNLEGVYNEAITNSVIHASVTSIGRSGHQDRLRHFDDSAMLA